MAQCPPNTKVRITTASHLSSLDDTASRLLSESRASMRNWRRRVRAIFRCTLVRGLVARVACDVKIRLARVGVLWFRLQTDCNWHEHFSPSLQNQRWLVCWPSCCFCPPPLPSVQRTENLITLIACRANTNVCFVSLLAVTSLLLNSGRFRRAPLPASPNWNCK